MSPNGNGWNEWSRHVLAELKRLSDGIERVEERFAKVEGRMAKIESEISALRVKAGVWGFIAGALPSTVAIVWVLVSG